MNLGQETTIPSKALRSKRSRTRFRIWSALIALTTVIALASPGVASCPSEGPTAPVTVDNEVSTIPSSRQLVNGAGTTVNTSTPNQIKIDVTNTSVALTGAGGRLTISSTSPLPQNTNGSTLYYLPYSSTKVALYNGTQVVQDDIGSSGISVAVPSTTATTYDAYVSDSSGSPVLNLVAWANSTTPPTRGLSNGIPYTNNNTQDRWVGSVYTDPSTSGKVDDSASLRCIWNHDNQMPSPVTAQIPTASFTTTSTSLTTANANTTYGQGRIGALCGITGGSAPNITYSQPGKSSTTDDVAIAIGLDSTSAASSNVGSLNGTGIGTVCVPYSPASLAAGFHFFQMLIEVNGGTGTFYGNGTSAAAPGDSLSGVSMQ